MSTTAIAETAPDQDLWQLVRTGNTRAFELVVRRHQSVVCAVAYNACGDLALSEDVAQETFWAAWREQAALEQPNRLRSWLCGIARNLAKNAKRRAERVAQSAAPLHGVTELTASTPGPEEEAVTREEESLVWQTLEQIPESYREPLILFYRENQSVAQVAAALDLSEDAVKQRLSRGRGMLKDRVAGLVEGTLQRSRPGQALTVAVMTGLAAISAGTKTAFAGTGAAAAGVVGSTLKTATTGVSGSILGSLLGPLLGLFGGWFGTWLPAQVAPTKGEREFLLRIGRRMLLVSLLFIAVLFLGIYTLAKPNTIALYLGFLAGLMVAFGAYVAIESFRAAREVQRLRTVPLAEPNDAPLRVGLDKLGSRFRGRVYRSRATLFGAPLVDINVSDPIAAGGTGSPLLLCGSRGQARGWIAIGDDAAGFIAIGGRAFGVLSIGGLATGLVAIGGVALGVLGIGGLGLGVIAIGGGAIGWQACGGFAVAWDVACGGGAAAWHAAYGGAAVAHDYAVGGGVWAQHANDEAAKSVLLNHPFTVGFGWYGRNVAWITSVGVLLLALFLLALFPVMYRREKQPQS